MKESLSNKKYQNIEKFSSISPKIGGSKSFSGSTSNFGNARKSNNSYMGKRMLN